MTRLSFCQSRERVFPDILELLKIKKASDISVLGGGIIPEGDIEALKKLGVKAVFTSANSLSEMVQFIKGLCLK